jgi:hypothetical protein
MLEKLSKGFYGPVLPPIVNVSPVNAPPPIIGKDAAATIKSTELQTLLSSSDWMTSFLCETWDRRDFEYDTKTAGTAIVKNMCVSLIGACVPAYIQSLSKETASAINGGFTARAVFVYANEKSKNIEWPQSFSQLPGGADIYKKLQDDIITISNLRGEFSMDADAKTMFEDFYRSNAVRFLDTDSDVMQHFKSRIHVHAFKVAMALSASGGDSLIVSKQDMQVAITLMKQVQGNLDRTFRGFGTSQLAEATNRIQEFIEHRGITTRKEILTFNHKYASLEDIDRVLYMLRQIDYIQEENQGNKIQIKLTNNNGSNGVVGTSIQDLKGNIP